VRRRRQARPTMQGMSVVVQVSPISIQLAERRTRTQDGKSVQSFRSEATRAINQQKKTKS
jgi:hypothetical protein